MLVMYAIASDGKHYEKRDKDDPICIEDEIPFEIPESWEWTRLESLIERIHYGFTCSSSQSGTIRLLRITDIQDNSVNWETVPFCSENPKHLDDYKLRRLDILIARTGGTVGKNYVVRDCPYDSVFASYLIRVAALESALVSYIELFMDAPLYWNQLIAAAAGTGQPNVNSTALGNLLLPIPPVAEQKRIVEFYSLLEPRIDEYDTLEAARERLDTELPDKVRKSILQMAVQGKLVEQDPNDEPASVLLDRIRAERGKLISKGKLKAPKGGESVIYRASDGGYYEKRGKGEPQPIEVPFDIPDSWEWVRLKMLGEIVGGGTPKTHDTTLWASPEDGVPWITPADMKNVHSLRVSHGERYLSEKGLAGSSAQLMPAGTVVMSSRAPIGYLAISECPIATNQGFKSIVPTLVNINAWIILALDALMDGIKKRASGTTFKEISGTEFGETLVPVPPFEEQRRIVENCKSLIATFS